VSSYRVFPSTKPGNGAGDGDRTRDMQLGRPGRPGVVAPCSGARAKPVQLSCRREGAASCSRSCPIPIFQSGRKRPPTSAPGCGVMESTRWLPPRANPRPPLPAAVAINVAFGGAEHWPTPMTDRAVNTDTRTLTPGRPGAPPPRESGYCCCSTDRMLPAGSLNQATASPLLRKMPLASCSPSGMS
jgi:hypothetical protein